MSEINFDEMQTVLMTQFGEIIKDNNQVKLDVERRYNQEKQQATDSYNYTAKEIKSQFDSDTQAINNKNRELSSYMNNLSICSSKSKEKISYIFDIFNIYPSGESFVQKNRAAIDALKSYFNQADDFSGKINSCINNDKKTVKSLLALFFIEFFFLWIITGTIAKFFCYLNRIDDTLWILSAAIFSFVVSISIEFNYIFTFYLKPKKYYSHILQITIEAKEIYNECVQKADQLIKNEERLYNERMAENEKKHEKRIQTIEDNYENIRQTAQKEFEAKLAELHRRISAYKQAVDTSSPRWDDEFWQSWNVASKLPDMIRIGELTTGRWNGDKSRIKDCQFSMPALLPFPSEQGILFSINGEERNLIAKQLQSLLLRLTASIPPGKLRFTFIDPVGLGQNAAAFLHLADYDESLVTTKAWSEPRHIEQRLGELTEHIENVIQKYLRNTYKTIEEFNSYAGELTEPYRFLIINDFPANFSEDAVRRLISILQNGPRCGIYTIIICDREKNMPHRFDIRNIGRHTRVFHSYENENQLIWGARDFKCLLSLDEPPAQEYFNTIISQVGKAAVAAMRVEVPFAKILEKAGLSPEAWQRGSTAEEIRIPLGPVGANRVQFLELGKGTSHHALIAGKIGSGKSTLLHVLIVNLALTYSPDEVQFYLIDFKKGVEFKTYAAHALPHARVIAIESEREFGLSVLQDLDALLKRRGDLFRKAEVADLKNYRRKTSQIMPRIILLVDEFQEFFTEDDPVAAKVSQILDRLVRQGRAFGVHIILGSQTLAGTYTLARSTIDQMAVRIALQCSETDSRLILSDDNAAARLLSRPGEAIYNAANGLVEGNNPFQVAWLPDEERDQYLDKINALARQQNFAFPQSQIVFEGNAPAASSNYRAAETFFRLAGRADCHQRGDCGAVPAAKRQQSGDCRARR
ncbi:MAG: FtsK/SpoIIIE family protein [Candidatus Electronema aureum]|uniref:FtsK/SpoIIIE family protein n=1 Tax=Candidatus Electronema aureum TaxID=2005002 RepID=A0A521G511_9BACT|nr:MAG: FtsK/SpoIIIE family protein [Candidatus Electronema aureum]